MAAFLIVGALPGQAQSPSATSVVGGTVVNPVTGGTTTVSGLVCDPGPPYASGSTAFVQTADGYTFLVKTAGQTVYNTEVPPVAFTVVNVNTGGNTVTLHTDSPLYTGGAGGDITFTYGTLSTSPDLAGFTTPVTDGTGTQGTPPTVVGGAGGVKIVGTGSNGSNGSNGHAGALVVPPSSGGDGATGPESLYDNWTNISTTNQIGIEAGSIGGNGGNGGSAYLAVWSGRRGGDAGSGGLVSVANHAGTQVATTGAGMYGIFAYSRSGEAGNGGFDISVAVSGAKDLSADLALGIGGFGGGGGNGGAVDSRFVGNVFTEGNHSAGIVTQSLGGGGGNGGLNVSAAISVAKSFSVGLGVGVGGDGGNADAVSNVVTGTVSTQGDHSTGVLAQSVGGGGGNGGLNVTGALSVSLENGGALGIGLGGFGGAGGDAGSVVNNVTGNVFTFGNYSDAIFSQSLGGGGGNGALNVTGAVNLAKSNGGSVGVGIGGFGGSGGDAGAVSSTVTIADLGANTSGLGTQGAFSSAVVAQSIGGGGGNAGDVLLFHGSASLASGKIYTSGTGAVGIEASSIGGGGGDAGINLSAALAVKAGTNNVNSFNVTVGGAGGDGGVGGDVQVANYSAIETMQAQSHGILAQSLGGGGGNANLNISFTKGSGTNGFGFNLTVGGATGDGAHAGNVDVTQVGDITTHGNRSTGVMAQSIGGGGGNAGFDLGITLVDGYNIGIGIGSLGGVGGYGGDVTLRSDGFIATFGDYSGGLLAQSIGGGGGNSSATSFSVAAPAGSGTTPQSIAVSIGMTGGTGGYGGRVLLEAGGVVFTGGLQSHGIVAQSIGGGGGNGGMAVSGELSAIGVGLTSSGSSATHISIAMGGWGGNGNAGGDVFVLNSGTIQVKGDSAYGILAQSVGGGGGIVDRLFLGTAGGAGTAGSVTVTADGNIVASGLRGVGIFAQSSAADGQGDIAVELTGGKLLSFGSEGEGVHLSGGAQNAFTNRGTVVGEDRLTGWAVIGEEGNDVVFNYGALVGQVNLGSGANRFDNHANALLVMGPLFQLGNAANTLTNDGQLVIGGTGNAQRTELEGSFVQSAGGSTFAELDFGPRQIDSIYMTGAARLSGTLALDLLNPGLIRAGRQSETLFHAELGVADEGMALVTAPSMVVLYALDYNDPLACVLNYNVDFATHGKMGPNLTEVGHYINRVQNHGSSPALADTITKLLYIPSLGEYRWALSQLAPDFYGEHQAALLRLSQGFHRIVLDGGTYRFGGKEQLFWIDFQSDNTLHRAWWDYKETRQEANGITAGFRTELPQDWSLDLAVSMWDNNARGYGGLWKADGTTEQVGLAVRRKVGDFEFSGLASYSWNQMEVRREGFFPEHFNATADRELEALTLSTRAAYELRRDAFALKALVDFGYTNLQARQTREKNGGPTGLILSDNSEDYLWVRPALEASSLVTLTDRVRWRPYVRAAWHGNLNRHKTYARGRFTESPEGAAPIMDPVELGSFVSLSIGSEFLFREGLSLGFDYTRAFDSHYEADIFNLRLSITF